MIFQCNLKINGGAIFNILTDFFENVLYFIRACRDKIGRFHKIWVFKILDPQSITFIVGLKF